MVEAVRIYVRYETPNDKGETRRARNEKAGEFTPEFFVPDSGRYLWEIHQGIMNSVNRVIDGAYRIISPSEFESWFRLTQTIVYPAEYDILCAMERMFCTEANKEIEDFRAREQAEREREIERNRKSRGK